MLAPEMACNPCWVSCVNQGRTNSVRSPVKLYLTAINMIKALETAERQKKIITVFDIVRVIATIFLPTSRMPRPIS